MPRKARVLSESGIYHILMTSLNDEVIFKDNEDSEKFLNVIESYKDCCGFKIYAWCIMPGHLHLLMQTQQMSLGDVFKRIGGKFAYWYNQKYSRQGPLFKDRYKSEPIENDKEFLKALRFIHQNPVKHELATQIAEYKLSSYSAYTDNNSTLVNTNYAWERLPIEQFLQFNNAENNDDCLDVESSKRMNDEQVKKIIYRISKCKTIKEFQELPNFKKELFIKKIKDEGVSFRQLSKHTGVGIGVVRRCCDESSIIPLVYDRLLKRNKNTSTAWLTNGLK